MNNLAKVNELEGLTNEISQLIWHIKKNNTENIEIEIDLLMQKFRTAYDNCLALKYSPKNIVEIETKEPELKTEQKLEYFEPVIEKISITEKIEPEQVIEKEMIQEPIVENVVVKEEVSEIEIEKEKPIIENISQTTPEKLLKKENEIIADMFENKRSINEKIAPNKRDLATKFKDNPIKDINSAIGLNDKFLFIRELFSNNGEIYSNAIEKLNSFENLDQAMQFINTEFHWDAKNPTFNKFLELVYRRYIS
ncbi:MAG: hypothetical protein A2033_13385 [Bacteroidetes bacterium GWA2_31_9]|nr:MAG: hypothetical protein A2033_13385 [Bacteroidetes bacterium GWA2_31_9]